MICLKKDTKNGICTSLCFFDCDKGKKSLGKDFLPPLNCSKKLTKQFDHSTVRQKKTRIRSFTFWKNRRFEKNITTLSDF